MNTISVLNTFFSESTPLKKREFHSGEHIFHPGDSVHHIFGVEKGQAKLVRFTAEGRAIILHRAKTGESFAEAALFSKMYHCHAIAEIPSRIIFYPKKSILNAFRNQPERAEAFIALLASQVRTLRARLELRNILSARERIFQYLLLVARPEDFEVVIEGSFKDLASELGLAYETLYRELSRLEKDGILKRRKKTIKILKFSDI